MAYSKKCLKSKKTRTKISDNYQTWNIGGDDEGRTEGEAVNLFLVWVRGEYRYWTFVYYVMQGIADRMLRISTRKLETV